MKPGVENALESRRQRGAEFFLPVKRVDFPYREAGGKFGQWGTLLVRMDYVLLQDTQSLWINTVTGHFPLLSGSNIDQAILFQAVTQEPRLHPSHVLVILWWLQALPDIIQPAEGWGRWSLWTRCLPRRHPQKLECGPTALYLPRVAQKNRRVALPHPCVSMYHPCTIHPSLQELK